jgi:hypothetical protein
MIRYLSHNGFFRDLQRAFIYKWNLYHERQIFLLLISDIYSCFMMISEEVTFTFDRLDPTLVMTIAVKNSRENCRQFLLLHLKPDSEEGEI